MTQPVYGADSREPFFHNGERVSYTEKRSLKDGTIVYEFNGPKPKRLRKTFKDMTPSEVARAVEKLLPVARGERTGDTTMRLEPLYDACLKAMKSGEFKHSDGRYSERSIELFEGKCDPQSPDKMGVLDRLGRKTRVADIKVGHLRRMMQDLEDEGLSGSTVRSYMSQASTLLRYAVAQEVVDSNESNKIGRGERPSAKRKSKPRYLSVAQARLLFAQMTDVNRTVAQVMFWGALRVSEALALTWGDVKDDLAVGGTKTRASDGDVPLHPELIRVLSAHRALMRNRGIHLVADDQLVFQSPKTGKREGGKRIDRHNVLRAIKRAGVKAGLQKDDQQPIGCHDLRHSLAANLLANPENTLLDVKEMLRHSNVAVTAAVYSDLVEGEGRKKLREKLAAVG